MEFLEKHGKREIKKRGVIKYKGKWNRIIKGRN